MFKLTLSKAFDPNTPFEESVQGQADCYAYQELTKSLDRKSLLLLGVLQALAKESHSAEISVDLSNIFTAQNLESLRVRGVISDLAIS